MRINTEDDGVFEVEVNIDKIRGVWDTPEGVDDFISEITDVLDNAQGFVHSENGDKAFIVITVTK